MVFYRLRLLRVSAERFIIILISAPGPPGVVWLDVPKVGIEGTSQFNVPYE